jgi:hypothetical protein
MRRNRSAIRCTEEQASAARQSSKPLVPAQRVSHDLLGGYREKAHLQQEP